MMMGLNYGNFGRNFFEQRSVMKAAVVCLFSIPLSVSCTTPDQLQQTADAGMVRSHGRNGGRQSGGKSTGCLQLSEDLRQRLANSGFVGFGEGASADGATSAASADLLGQVQTQISSVGTVSETATSVEVASLTESTVQAMLTGLKIDKRCQSDNGWQAVVSLGRDTFFKNIRLRIKPVLDQATKIDQALSQENLKTLAVKDQLLEAVRGKRLLGSVDGRAAGNLLLICQTFNSCGMIDGAVLARLPEAINRVFGRYTFSMQAKDPDAESILDQVTRMLNAEGLAVTTSVSANEATLSCQRKEFPPMAQTGYMVTDLICQVVFATTNGEPIAGFTRAFKGHGLGETRDESLSEARRRLVALDPD